MVHWMVFNRFFLPPDTITLALDSSGRSDFEISCPRKVDNLSFTLISGTFSTGALPPSVVGAKFVPRIVITLTGSFAFSVWIAFPKKIKAYDLTEPHLTALEYKSLDLPA